MTEAERRAFNAGLEAAREFVLRTGAAARRELPAGPVPAIVSTVLDEIVDGLGVMMRVGITAEAVRRAAALL